MTPPLAKVLIIDDEPVMRTIAESILLQNGFAVSTVDSAEEALAMLETDYSPDLILLDVLMPGMNGFEACRRLRQQRRFEHLPVVMLTALDDQASIDEAYRCGATDFITKPLNLPLLPYRVRYLLRSADAIREVVDSQLNLLHTQQIAHLGNWTMDRHGNIVAASDQYLQIVGEAALPIAPAQSMLHVHQEDRELLRQFREQLALDRPYRIDYRLLDHGQPARWRHVHERGFPSVDGEGAVIGATGFTQDITERIAQEARLRDLAWNDPVTGINNRSRLSELIERDLTASESERPMAVFYAHIPTLRDIAAVVGQEIADDAIRQLARRLQVFLQNHDTICDCVDRTCLSSAKLGRYDEHAFVIAITGIVAEQAIRCFAQAIATQIGEPLHLHGQEMRLKSIVGIALHPTDASDGLQLMRRAMLSAHHAASLDTTPTVAFFDPEHDREASDKISLEHDLRAALERRAELEPHVQPKICARTGKILGGEVLLRWRHPARGLISPARFIPLAERCGLIHPISEWLIEHVCDTLAAWQRSGFTSGPLSINLSAVSFYQQGLIHLIDQTLLRTGIASEQLIIELTEGVLMQNSETANHVINQLRERGIRLSLDDFGTGFSSLGYLNRFPIDEIKIDRSFVEDIESDPRRCALVEGIITLGHALGLKVVAEGVETQGQARRLADLGCDIFQGYLFAKPMPIDAFRNFERIQPEMSR